MRYNTASMAGNYETQVGRIKEELAHGKVVHYEAYVPVRDDDPDHRAFMVQARVGSGELYLWSECVEKCWLTEIYVVRGRVFYPDTPSYPISPIVVAGEAIRVVEEVRTRLQAGESLESIAQSFMKAPEEMPEEPPDWFRF